MYDTDAHKTIINSIIVIPEDAEEDSSIGQDSKSTKSTTTKKSKKSKKSGSSSSSSSSTGSKSSKKSKSKKDKKSSSKKRKSKRHQSTSPTQPLEQEQPLEQQQSQPEPVTPRKVIKKVSFADWANHVIERDDIMSETESLWWTRAELAGIEEEVHEHCNALEHEEEYFQALQTVYSDPFDTSYSGDALTLEQQQAMHILIKYDSVGRGLEQKITEEASHERIGQHRHATLEAMYRVQGISQRLPSANSSGRNPLKCSCSRFVSSLSGTFSCSSRNMAFIMAKIDAHHAWTVYSEL